MLWPFVVKPMLDKLRLELVREALSFPMGKFTRSDGSINRRQITLLHKDYQQDALNYIFIRRAIEAHGVFFGYENVKFSRMDQFVEIYCPDHEDYFRQTAKNHLDGYGCPKCREKFVTRVNEYGEFRIPAYYHKFSLDGNDIIWYTEHKKLRLPLEKTNED